MIERGWKAQWLPHAALIVGVLLVALPLFVTLSASTHRTQDILQVPMPLMPGEHLVENYTRAFSTGPLSGNTGPVWRMMLNSLVMALGIALGKILISLLSAFAIVYFRFPLRQVFFWMIFVTLMLPVEVRIIPTYKVVSDLGMLDSYAGLIFPLIASATATFLFRQFFLTIPDEIFQAARIDGAGPFRFFTDILIPLSRNNIAALFVILFIYGWNQYLWPLIITTNESMYTILIGINRMLAVADDQADWPVIMATSVLAMVPPVLVVIFMQHYFVKGLTETEK